MLFNMMIWGAPGTTLGPGSSPLNTVLPIYDLGHLPSPFCTPTAGGEMKIKYYPSNRKQEVLMDLEAKAGLKLF